VNAAGVENSEDPSPTAKARERQSARLRILQVCSIKGRGGTGYMASHLSRLLASRGHEVIVAACAGSLLEARARQDGLRLAPPLSLRRGFHPLALLRDVITLRQCICAERIQIVHAWHSIEYWSCGVALLGLAARLARTRGLTTPVKAHIANRWLHRRTAALFVTCRRIAEMYAQAGFAQNNIFMLRDGVDLARFHPGGGDRQRLRRELGLAESVFFVLSVGRLQPVKGHSVFLRAMARLPGDVRAAIAGDGWLKEALLAEHRLLGLGDRVRFLGMREDIPDLLAAADAYALTSIGSEGSSRATLEAMAAGVPVIAADVGMLPDIVRTDETGILVPPSDIEALVGAIDRLRRDPALRQRLRQNAREFVQREHSEERMVAGVEEAYLRIAGAI